MLPIRFLLVLTTLVLAPVGALAYTEDAKLTASDGAANDFFGRSVSISGDTSIVGALGDSDNGTNSGSAYVFRDNGSAWVEEKLTASDGAADDFFGESVSISGDTTVIGARLDDDNGANSGSAYVFRDNGSAWVEEKLTASDGAANDFFGSSVSISGDTAVIGALGDGDNGANSGSAYVFRDNGSAWVEEKLTASDGAAEDLFGNSVAIAGDTAVIGAIWDDDNGDKSGSAYVFSDSGSTWVETKLTASDGALEDFFGGAVAISGDTAIVGAHGDDDNGTNSGSAYVFRYNGSIWVETKLTASDGAAGDLFGSSVSISGDTALVGALSDADNGTNSGSVYVFSYNGSTWVETKLTASDGETEDLFGRSVANSGDIALVGASGDSDNGTNSGSAYVFLPEPSTALLQMTSLLGLVGLAARRRSLK